MKCYRILISCFLFFQIHASTCDGQVDSTVEETIDEVSLSRQSGTNVDTSETVKDESCPSRPIAASGALEKQRPR